MRKYSNARLKQVLGFSGSKEVFRDLEAGVQLIGPERAIPLRTPIENLKEIPRAVRDSHRGHTGSN